LVMEKMRKIVLCAIGVLVAGLCRPIASNQPILPWRATSTVTPGIVPLSISRLNASDIFCRRFVERPIDPGLASGRGGVCGAVAGFAVAGLAAVCAFMISPVMLLSLGMG